MFKQLIKDSALYGFADFFFKILAFFTFPIFAHLLSVNDYGVLSFAGVIAGFVGMFMSLGLNNAIQRFYFDVSIPEEERPALVSTGYIILAIWSTVLTLFFILAAYIFKDYILLKYQLPFSYLALALLTNIPVLLLTYSNDTIRLHFKLWKFFLLAFCRNLAGIGTAIVLMKYYHMGLWGYFIANFFATLFFVPLGIYLTKKDVKLLFNKKIGGIIVRFGYPFIFAGLAYWVFGSMDRWMLAEWSTMEQAGLYSIAFKFGSIVLFINSAFSQAWSPIAIKIMHEQPDSYRVLFSKLFTYWFAILLILGTASSFFAYEFLRFATPESYWKAADVSIWVIMGLVFSSTTQLTAVGISISKKTKYFTYIAWITAGINFLVNLLLIPYWGALGSAVATFITYIILSGGYLVISQRLHPLPLQRFKLALLFGFLVISLAVSLYLNTFHWTFQIVLIKCGWLCVLVFLLLKFKIVDLPALRQIFIKSKNG